MFDLRHVTKNVKCTKVIELILIVSKLLIKFAEFHWKMLEREVDRLTSRLFVLFFRSWKVNLLLYDSKNLEKQFNKINKIAYYFAELYNSKSIHNFEKHKGNNKDTTKYNLGIFYGNSNISRSCGAQHDGVQGFMKSHFKLPIQVHKKYSDWLKNWWN